MAKFTRTMNIIVPPFNTTPTHRPTSFFVQDVNYWNNISPAIKRKPSL
jgi:hypothetical protein